MERSIILDTDSYKLSQFAQYPPNTAGIYSYVSSRGGLHPEVVWFGLQMLLQKLFTKPITQGQINFAEEIALAHGEPFNREGWEYILKEHGGFLPLLIKSLPEGLVVPTKNALLTVENTDGKCAWLTDVVETPILRGVWYPTTVATNSFETKKLILSYLIRNGDPNLIDYKLHDFGARGVSSEESASIGGLAHLVNFKGTDTISALLQGREFYSCPMAAYSIPAMQHSTVTAWGKEHEVDSYRNMLRTFGQRGKMFAAVCDAYDIYNACEKLWGEELRQEVIDSGATVIIRPDSGEPSEVVHKCAEILANKFGYEVNSKGYKVLNHVRIIQGDGLDDLNSFDRILNRLELNGFSADNIAFGQGGGLLQKVDRDQQKFAMKCSAARVDGQWRDVYKDPITDPGKASLRGRLQVISTPDGLRTVSERPWNKDLLQEVYRDGKLLNMTTFDEVRVRTSKHLHSYFSHA